MLIDSSWDTSCGEFLCGCSGMLAHGLHQNAALQKKAHAARPAPGNSPDGEAKARFQWNICCSALSASPSRAPDLRAGTLQEELGVLLTLSTEFDFLQRNRQHAELKNDTLLQVRGLDQSWF